MSAFTELSEFGDHRDRSRHLCATKHEGRHGGTLETSEDIFIPFKLILHSSPSVKDLIKSIGGS